MTEDDTFRILRRTPVQNMDIEIIDACRRYSCLSYLSLPNSFYEEHGWTITSYAMSASEHYSIHHRK